MKPTDSSHHLPAAVACPSHKNAVSRRHALRTLGLLAAGGWLMNSSEAQAADAATPAPTTSEPTGNAGIDHSLAAFEFAPLATTRLTDTLALLAGPGGNMAVLASPGGAVLVDTGVHPRALSVAKAAETFAGKPVSIVINTHWHFDHSGGNEVFGRQGARIIAHDATRARLSTDQTIEAFGFTFHAAPAAALPVLTFADTLSLYPGSEVVQLHHMAPAHTDGDILVHFTKANVLQMGDAFFNGFYPFIDYSSGGWIGGMVAAAERGLALCDEKTRVIPGHGPLSGKMELSAARDMLAAVQDRLEKLLDTGKSPDEIVAAAPTKDFDDRWGKGFFNAENFTRNAVAGIMRHREAMRQ